MKERIKKHLRDPLYTNSFYIMLNYVTGAAFGFFFWVIAAKIYSKTDVGLATAVISSMTLLVTLTRVGFDFSIIRFFPEKNKSNVFNTALWVTAILVTLAGIIFVLGVDLFSSNLEFLKNPQLFILFLLFLISSSMISVIGTSFIAIRKAKYQFLQSLIVGSRVFFLFPFVFLGAFGIFSSVGLSFLIAAVFLLIPLIKSGIHFSYKVDWDFLKESFNFSITNYISGLLISAPPQILPIIILNLLGAEEAAHYYIAYAIASLVFMIPAAVSTSLFVEGSHGEKLKKTVIKSLINIYVLLIPAVIFLYLFSDKILELISKDYSAGSTQILQTLIIASLFMAINSVYFSIKRIQKDTKQLIPLSSLTFILLIGLSYLLTPQQGLIGIGYAWITTYIIQAIIIMIQIKRDQWI